MAYSMNSDEQKTTLSLREVSLRPAHLLRRVYADTYHTLTQLRRPSISRRRRASMFSTSHLFSLAHPVHSTLTSAPSPRTTATISTDASRGDAFGRTEGQRCEGVSWSTSKEGRRAQVSLEPLVFGAGAYTHPSLTPSSLV